ncbi:hypothetical protein D3C71_1495450 [compost metagenome]
MRHHVAQQRVRHVGAGAAHRVFQRGRMQAQQIAGGIGFRAHPLHGVAAGFHVPVRQGVPGRRVQRQPTIVGGAQHGRRRDDLADGAHAIQRVAGGESMPRRIRIAKARAPDDALIIHDGDRHTGHLGRVHVVGDTQGQVCQHRRVIVLGDGCRRGGGQALATARGKQQRSNGKQATEREHGGRQTLSMRNAVMLSMQARGIFPAL